MLLRILFLFLLLSAPLIYLSLLSIFFPLLFILIGCILSAVYITCTEKQTIPLYPSTVLALLHQSTAALNPFCSDMFVVCVSCKRGMCRPKKESKFATGLEQYCVPHPHGCLESLQIAIMKPTLMLWSATTNLNPVLVKTGGEISST